MNSLVQKIEKINLTILIILSIGSVLFFIPSAMMGVDSSKLAMIGILLPILILLLSLRVWKLKTVTLPSGKIVKALYGLIFVSLICTLASPVVWKSLIGNGFDIGSSITLISLCVLTLFSSVFLKRVSDQLYIVSSILLSFVIVLMYIGLRIFFGADFLDFGYFTFLASNMFGSLNDIGMMSAIFTVILTYTSFFVKTSAYMRCIIRLLALFGYIALFTINSQSAWILVAIGGIIFALKSFFEVQELPRSLSKKFISILKPYTLVLLLISVFALIFPSWSGLVFAERSNLSEQTVRPSWQMTTDLIAESLKLNPFVGIGPNRFTQLYVATRPIEVNSQPWWNVDFGVGVSYITTLLTTHGLIFFAIVIMLYVFGIRLGSVICRNPIISLRDHIRLIAYSATVMGLSACLFTNPGVSLLIITALFGGITLSSLDSTHTTVALAQENGSRLKIKNLVLLGVVCLALVYGALQIQNIVLNIHSTRIYTAFTEGKTEQALRLLGYPSHITFASDTYYRTLAELSSTGIQGVLNRLNIDNQEIQSDNPDVINLQHFMEKAVYFARQAVLRDSTNYQNHITEAKIAEIGTMMGVSGARDIMVQAYTQAIVRNPFSPTMYLYRGNAEVYAKNYTEAEKYIVQARYLKPDYIDAVRAHAELYVRQNKQKEALQIMDSLLQVSGNDPAAHFEVGLFKFGLKNYSSAQVNFEEVLKMVPGNFNASVYLGLSLAEQGKKNQALEILIPLQQISPENQELQQIINNLREGKNALTGAVEPLPKEQTQVRKAR